jgi:hypothetical protein
LSLCNLGSRNLFTLIDRTRGSWTIDLGWLAANIWENREWFNVPWTLSFAESSVNDMWFTLQIDIHPNNLWLLCHH